MIKDISTIQPGEAENDTDRLLDPPSMPWPEGSIEATMAPEARAQLLTERIRENGSTAARAVWAIGRDLRTMKAEKLFQELGYDTFEDYAEQEFQLKRRQAYTYISVYEKIGQNEPVQSTAQLGITKLSLLTTVDAEDRAEILAEHDVAGMTTKELEKLLEDYKIQGEQLSLLEGKVEELESVRMDTNALIDRAEKLEAERDEWIAEAKAAKEAVKELEATKGKPEIVEKIVEKEVVKEVSDTQELNLARQLQKEAETKAEKAEERAEGAEKKLDKKHKDLLAAEKRAKEAQTEVQELKDKLAAEAEKHRELQTQLESKHREWLQACDEKTSYAQQLFHAEETVRSLKNQVDELEARPVEVVAKPDEEIIKAHLREIDSLQRQHKEELEKVKAEAQKPVDSGDKQSFKHAYAASYKELTGLLEIIDSTDDKQERQIFQAKAEQLLALVGEKLHSMEEAENDGNRNI